MKFLTFLVIVLTTTNLSSARRVEKSCPKDVKTITNFDMKQYLDKWYEIKRYTNNFQQSGDCATTEFLNDADGNYKFTHLHLPKGKFVYENKTGYARISYPDDLTKPGKISISFSKNFKESNYWILDTDYNNYAVIWYCKEILDNVSEELAWVMSRTPEITAEVQKKIDESCKTYLNPDLLLPTQQDKDVCGYEYDVKQ